MNGNGTYAIKKQSEKIEKPNYNKTFAKTPMFGREFKVAGGEIDYSAGDRVSHIKFGEGTVLDISKGSKDYEVKVLFDRKEYGVKCMFASFAKLKKIN